MEFLYEHRFFILGMVLGFIIVQGFKAFLKKS